MLLDTVLEQLARNDALDIFMLGEAQTPHLLKDAVYFNLDGEFTNDEDYQKTVDLNSAIISGKPMKSIANEDFIDSCPPYPNMVIEVSCHWKGMHLSNYDGPNKPGGYSGYTDDRLCVWLVQMPPLFGTLMPTYGEKVGQKGRHRSRKIEAFHMFTQDQIDLINSYTMQELSQLKDEVEGDQTRRVPRPENGQQGHLLLGDLPPGTYFTQDRLDYDPNLPVSADQYGLPDLQLYEKVQAGDYQAMRGYSMVLLDFEETYPLRKPSHMSDSGWDHMFGPLSEPLYSEDPAMNLITSELGVFPGFMLFHFYQYQDWSFDWANMGLTSLAGEMMPFPNYFRCMGNEVVRTIFKTISVINCNNVELIDIHPNKKRQKSRRKKNKLPLVSHKTLRIKGKKSYASGNGQPSDQDTTNRVHLCRGHFKTFTDDNPLFGKYIGRYWWQPQVRGSKSQGLVNKDYQVEKEA